MWDETGKSPIPAARAVVTGCGIFQSTSAMGIDAVFSPQSDVFHYSGPPYVGLRMAKDGLVKAREQTGTYIPAGDRLHYSRQRFTSAIALILHLRYPLEDVGIVVDEDGQSQVGRACIPISDVEE